MKNDVTGYKWTTGFQEFKDKRLFRGELKEPRYQTAAHSALISGDGKTDAASSWSDYLELSAHAKMSEGFIEGFKNAFIHQAARFMHFQ